MIFDILNRTKKAEIVSEDNKLVKIAALMIHAAKIDENYTQKEKKIIIDFLKSTNKDLDHEMILNQAEASETDSNQILEYTKEIKKNTLDFRKTILKILWKIILSDKNSDLYESNLMRRICGLLYLSDKISGEIKQEILKEKKL
tara:strand:- start:6066 stop:6497 length:432 start_codon:yes stop_codon:yes gene_type:complete